MSTMKVPLIITGVIFAAFFGLMAMGMSGHPVTTIFSRQQVLDAGPVPVNITNPNSPPVYDTMHLSILIHDKINQIRLQNNQTQTGYDDVIASIAQGHADDMNLRNYYSHDTPEGISAPQRGIDAGYQVCGDKTTRDMIVSFVKDQDINNAAKNNLNERMLVHNNKVRQYNTEIEGPQINNFNPNQKIIDAQTKQTLDNEGAILTGQANQLNDISKELAQRHAILDTRNDMIHEGFSENIILQDLWSERVLNNDGTYTYSWFTEDTLAQNIAQGWLNSPEHKKNMLYPYTENEGLGVSINYQTYTLYAVEDIC